MCDFFPPIVAGLFFEIDEAVAAREGLDLDLSLGALGILILCGGGLVEWILGELERFFCEGFRVSL